MVSGVGLARKALRVDLMSCLICWFFAVRLTAWRAAFFADLIIGIKISSSVLINNNSFMHYTGFEKKCKERSYKMSEKVLE